MRSVTRRSRQDEAPPDSVDKLVATFENLLIGGESFTTISVEQLAAEAGLARATFYLHFRNKGELVSHVMRNVLKELRHAAALSLSNTEHFGRAELQAFMREAVEVNFRHRAAIRTMVELSSYDRDLAREYAIFMDTQVADIRIVIEKLRSTGRHHRAASSGVADILAWAAERSCTKLLKDRDPKAKRQEFADRLTHVVWSAIASPDKAGG